MRFRHSKLSYTVLELIENGIDAEKRKKQQFFAMAERFRNGHHPAEFIAQAGSRFRISELNHLRREVIQ